MGKKCHVGRREKSLSLRGGRRGGSRWRKEEEEEEEECFSRKVEVLGKSSFERCRREEGKEVKEVLEVLED